MRVLQKINRKFGDISNISYSVSTYTKLASCGIFCLDLACNLAHLVCAWVSVLRHLARYVLFPKVNTLLCSTAHATLFKWSRFIVFSVSYEKRALVNEVCSWTHFKRVKTKLFCFKVEACCERAITFSIKVLWRVTYIQLYYLKATEMSIILPFPFQR